MSLVRWDTTRELDSLQSEMNRLFSSFLEPVRGGSNGSGKRPRWIPSLDLMEADGQFVLKADLPGMKEDQIKVELEHNQLTISGERRDSHEERKDGYYRVERASGYFSRSLTLPEGIEPEAIQAEFEDGVLTVRVPKPAQTQPRRVRIPLSGNGQKSLEESETEASGTQETKE